MTEEELKKHEELWETNADYRMTCDALMIPRGRKFTIALECINPVESMEIMGSLFGNEKLQMGCRIYRVDFDDKHEKWMELKTKLEELLNS